jgi:hypothetical protein
MHFVAGARTTTVPPSHQQRVTAPRLSRQASPKGSTGGLWGDSNLLGELRGAQPGKIFQFDAPRVLKARSAADRLGTI